MSLQEKLEKLQGDFSNLDADNIGGWPLAVKLVCWVLVMVAVIVASYQLVLKEQKASLDAEAAKEVTLRTEFEQKVQEAANIEAYRSQMKEMTESFSALLGQLPKDTEVPGLLDDISEKGSTSGLNFEAIDLLQEKKADFYVELPINIKVKGGYHDFGTFVSGVAGLPRIVTLHDFVIESADAKSGKGKAPGKAANTADAAQDKGRGSEELSMTIMAKTYRYKSDQDAEAEVEKAKAAAPKAAPAAGNKGQVKNTKAGNNSKGGGK